MNKIICSGTLFYSLDTQRFLLLHRAQGKTKNLWGLVGGTGEGEETPWEVLKREIQEEVGFSPTIEKTIPLETRTSTATHKKHEHEDEQTHFVYVFSSSGPYGPLRAPYNCMGCKGPHGVL